MPTVWDHTWTDQDIVPLTDEAEHWPYIAQYLSPPGRILEAGCGLARWVSFLEKKGFDSFGVDFSPLAIQRSLQVWPGMKLVRGDLRALPFENGFFRGIVSFGAIEHDEEGPDKALKELHRVLAPGGIMYCTVPCINGLRRLGYLALEDWIVCNRLIRRLTGRSPEVGFFEYVFTPQEYRDVLIAAGFSVVELIPLCPMEIPFLTRGKLLTAIWRRWPWFLCHMVAAVCRKPG